MKKLVALVLIAFLGLNTSQAKTNSADPVFLSQGHSISKTRIATRSVLVHALSKAQRRLFVINELTDDENDDAPGPDELDLQSPYRRPRIVENPHDDSISEHAMVRLAVARARAMAAYRKMHT
jgi:hypothetical protein